MSLSWDLDNTIPKTWPSLHISLSPVLMRFGAVPESRWLESNIKEVLDIRETEDCHNAFALLVRPPAEQANVLLSFQMTSDELPKDNWLKMLCRHVANTICKADAENLMYTDDPESFEVNIKDG
ncbi:Protein ECT2 [Heterocephalus glaber]|uniref:Protein ECT2 n=1 Tax=Heterocephalus glaber TaxID=10181 RepID=G5BCM8_HETGA|nr:Protein ECT2 [Heterocephalus glaber]